MICLVFYLVFMEKTCKVIVIGDSSVGKTTLIHRYISDEYRSDFKATLGADMCSKLYTKDDVTVEAQIWDTAGTERFRSISAQHYRGADACILVFDITNKESFAHIDMWRNEVVQSIGIEHTDEFPFVLLGNKADLIDASQVDQATVKGWTEQRNIPFFVVSAKTGENVDEAFSKSIEKHLTRKKTTIPLVIPTPLEPTYEKKSSCC